MRLDAFQKKTKLIFSITGTNKEKTWTHNIHLSIYFFFFVSNNKFNPSSIELLSKWILIWWWFVDRKVIKLIVFGYLLSRDFLGRKVSLGHIYRIKRIIKYSHTPLEIYSGRYSRLGRILSTTILKLWRSIDPAILLVSALTAFKFTSREVSILCFRLCCEAREGKQPAVAHYRNRHIALKKINLGNYLLRSTRSTQLLILQQEVRFCITAHSAIFRYPAFHLKMSNETKIGQNNRNATLFHAIANDHVEIVRLLLHRAPLPPTKMKPLAWPHLHLLLPTDEKSSWRLCCSGRMSSRTGCLKLGKKMSEEKPVGRSLPAIPREPWPLGMAILLLQICWHDPGQPLSLT